MAFSRTALYFALAVLSWRLKVALSSTATLPCERLLDLSFLHYVDASKLEEAIQASLWDLPIEERSKLYKINLSGSVLGDEKGMARIIKSLLPLGSDFTSTVNDAHQDLIAISLKTRRNQMSPQQVDELFQHLLIDQQKGATISNETFGSDYKHLDESDIMKDFNNPRCWTLEVLDAGWNELLPDARGYKKFLISFQKLIESREHCPKEIRFDHCGLGPAACRAIGKGIIGRFKRPGQQAKVGTALSISLCGNDLGDSGAAAIAAAIRTVAVDDKHDETIIMLDTLDLSACQIGDAGAEALALALESYPGMCIRHLILSNNKISDVGGAALGHALLSSEAKSTPVLESLDLSGNSEVKDKTATAIAEAFGGGLVSCVTLRSCNILADGAAAFGRAFKQLARRGSTDFHYLDLSGNQLGILRGKTNKDSKFSARAIKSKASATTSAYMNILRKGIKSGLKEYGVDFPGVESDDEEDARSGMGDELMNEGEVDPSKARCGIKAFVNEIVEDENEDSTDTDPTSKPSSKLRCGVAFRRCFLDHGAADALAAALIHSRDELGIDLSVDVALNAVLEEEMTDAIHGEPSQESALREMSERYLDALEALREARERASEAAKAAAARLEAEAELESQWNEPLGLDKDGWDDYENEEWDC